MAQDRCFAVIQTFRNFHFPQQNGKILRPPKTTEHFKIKNTVDPRITYSHHEHEWPGSDWDETAFIKTES